MRVRRGSVMAGDALTLSRHDRRGIGITTRRGGSGHHGVVHDGVSVVRDEGDVIIA